MFLLLVVVLVVVLVVLVVLLVGVGVVVYTYTNAPHVCFVNRGQKKMPDALEPELQRAMSHHIDTGNRTQLSCESSECLSAEACLQPHSASLHSPHYSALESVC